MKNKRLIFKFKALLSIALCLVISSCGIQINESITQPDVVDIITGDNSSDDDSASTPSTCEVNASATSYNEIGSGTESDPYLICTVEQFTDIGANTAAYEYTYKLLSDIDLSDYTEVADGSQYIPIGSSAAPFTGSFDGNYKTISNFTYTDTSMDRLGLFGYVENSRGVIKNLYLNDFNITGRDNIGAFAGRVKYGKYWNIKITGGNIIGRNYVGGFAGVVDRGSALEAIGTNITVGPTTNQRAAGIAGAAYTGSYIINSYALGDVTSANGYAGGLIGDCSQSIIFYSYASGNITSTNGAAGGFHGFSHHCRTESSFAMGNVSGNSASNYVGSFRGYTWTTGTSNNYYNSNATVVNTGTGGTNNAGTIGSYDLGASPNAFFDSSNPPMTSWDFDVWSENNSATSNLTARAVDFDSDSWGDCSSHLSDSPFAGGIGTVSSPYLICTASQLDAIDSNAAYSKSRVHKVMQDIDLSGETFAINDYRSYFDGNGLEISNYTNNSPAGTNIGLFSSSNKAVFINIFLSSINITGLNNVGGLIGNSSRSNVFNSKFSGLVNGSGNVGGVIGYGSANGINNLFSDIDVTGSDDVGGIAGHIEWGGSIESSVSVGNVIGGAANNVQPILGRGTVNNSAYDSSKSCTNCNAFNGTAIDSTVQTTYFFDATSGPMSTWDFVNTWVENASAFPDIAN